MPSDGPTWFATRKAAQAYAAKMARTGGSFGRPFSTTIEPFGPSVGWASSNESRESNLRDAESALGVQFRRSGQPRRVGAKRKAGGKTSTRKRVPSKRVANPDDIDAKTKFTLRREPLNSGGYDRYGEYFGRGAPLFVYEGEVPTSSRDVYGDTHRSQRDVRGHVRAADRQDAMAKIRQKYPMARFFGEKRKVASPARKRKAAAKRSWRVVIARDGRSLSVGSHVYEVVDATTRDGAMKAALRRHDSDARVVSLTELG